jgi:hypothetical protein
MTKKLENHIRVLQKGLAEVERDLAALRIQPCRGDSEIMAKALKSDELDKRATIIRRTIWDLTRKRQMMTSESNRGASCASPDSSESV